MIELVHPPDTISAIPSPLSPGAAANAKRTKKDEVPFFKQFRVCDAHVGHVDMDAWRAVSARSGTTATTDCFTEAETGIRDEGSCVVVGGVDAEGEDVAVALAGCARLEHADYDVGDALGCDLASCAYCGVW